MAKLPAPERPSPAALAAHPTHPVKIPVVVEVDPVAYATAAEFGVVEGDLVFAIDGDARHEVGAAVGEEPLKPYVHAFLELATAVERFHARLQDAELSNKDIDSALAPLAKALEEPKVVGNLLALRVRLNIVTAEANALKEKAKAARDAARAEATAAREDIVAKAEAIAAKPTPQVHWKNDTTELRDLLEAWKVAQQSGARLAKDVERALWKRFTTARSHFEKERRQHFSTLDKENSEVAARKDQLVASAEALVESTDWDKSAKAFADLMGQWRTSGRGRRSTDDALWKRFQKAQDEFFERRRAAEVAEDEALAGNVAAKTAVVIEAEKLLPVKDLAAAKAALRNLQDRFESTGKVPKAEETMLARRMTAVEKSVRGAEDHAWQARNPELEARAHGMVAQLHAAIADLDAKIAEAKAKGDTRAVESLTEARSARSAWLAQVETPSKK